MKNKKTYLIYIIGGVLSSFLNGLFGSGGGTLIVPFMTEFLKLEEHKAHATAILIILSFTLVSLVFYGMNSFLDLKLSLWVSLGGVVGGFIGAKLLAKLSADFIRKMFGVFMLIAAIRMVIK